MKKTILPLALAALALMSAHSVTAHGVFGLGGSKLAEYDTDGDGTLSEEERAAAKAAREEARQAIIDEFDGDGDGYSPSPLLAPPLGHPRPARSH